MTETSLLTINDHSRLHELLPAATRIGIDTEFMREKTYFSQLCLVQVAAGDQIACIDPLVDADDGADAAWDDLLGCDWVLHSGRQDIEVLYQATGKMPAGVWDTQVAAGLLGYQPQIGYANMVAELFDVQLDKSQTRADWSRRPLADDMLRYAAEDVLYLLPAADMLAEKLESLGRLAWAEQDSAELLQTSLYDIDPTTAVSRVKGANNTRGPVRNIAVALAEWREREALRRDRPRQWILRDNHLLDIAHRRPSSRADLQRIDGLPPRTIERRHKDILAAVAAGENSSNDYQPPRRPDEAERARLKMMKARVADVAKKLGIATEVLAPKRDLSAALNGDQDSRLFNGWRDELLGDELRSLI